MLPLVVTLESNEGHVRRYAFADSPVSIGRSPFTDLQLSESFVSRWEGTLRFDADEITYFSLGSTNPTFVNGRPIAPGEDTLLPPGAVVTLGELTLRFSREPVPESDVRRKGKPKPVREGQETSLKTAYLDVSSRGAGSFSERPSAAPAYESRSQSAPPPSHHTPSAPPSQPPEARGDVRLLGRVTVAGVGTPPAVSRPETAAPVASYSNSPNSASSSRGRFDPQQADASSTWSRPSEAPRAAYPVHAEATLPDLHAAYRAAWERFLELIARELEQLPKERRADYAQGIQHSFPQTVREPKFRALLERHGLSVRRSDVPEVEEWLRDIAREVLPPRMNLDTGLTLERILGLLETLTQSLGEINDAQNTVRQRWLGRQPKRSVLGSENGRAILAYLLNPQADWSARLLELEQTIRQAVTHELALFQATIEGARLLIQSVSPQSIANEVGVDLSQLESSPRGTGLWGRFRTKESPEALLWQSFVKTYETLMDSDRYQRVFLGRSFAKTYLAAMGQGKRES